MADREPRENPGEGDPHDDDGHHHLDERVATFAVGATGAQALRQCEHDQIPFDVL